MLEAMKIAGLFEVTLEGKTTYGFISEPEAAASRKHGPMHSRGKIMVSFLSLSPLTHPM